MKLLISTSVAQKKKNPELIKKLQVELRGIEKALHQAEKAYDKDKTRVMKQLYAAGYVKPRKPVPMK